MRVQVQTESPVFTYNVDEVDEQAIINYARQFLKIDGYSEDPDAEYDLDHYRTVAVSTKLNRDSYQWAIGDIVIAMRRRLGRLTEAIMEEFSSRFGEEIGTIYNYATTAEKWAKERRIVASHVSFSHHVELNGLPEEEQDELIAAAYQKRYSVRWLRDIVKSRRNDNGFSGTVEQSVPDIGNTDEELAPENNLSSIGQSQSADDDKPRPDNEYEQMADKLEGDEGAYTWTDHEVENDRRGLTMLAHDPVVAADQLITLVKNGTINAGWVASMIQRLMQELEV